MGVMSALACSLPSRAAAQPYGFEGAWIWDEARYVPPPGLTALSHMMAETMSVSRDDGAHYTARIHQVFDNGAVTDLDEDIAEDGADHAIGAEEPKLLVRISLLPDGGRHVVSARGGETHDSVCHVSEGGRTLTCNGTHKAADGSTGDYVCVYHRDPHVIPASLLIQPRHAHRT